MALVQPGTTDWETATASCSFEHLRGLQCIVLFDCCKLQCIMLFDCCKLPCHSQMLCASCAACRTQGKWILKCSHVRLFSPAVGRKPCNSCDSHIQVQCICRILSLAVAVLRQQTILHQESSAMCNAYHQIPIGWQNERGQEGFGTWNACRAFMGRGTWRKETTWKLLSVSGR